MLVNLLTKFYENPFKLLNKVKIILVFLIIFLFVIVTGIKGFTIIKNSLNVVDVRISIETSYNIDNIKAYRISPKGQPVELTKKVNSFFSLKNNVYYKNIILAINKDDIKKINEITIKIGTNIYKYENNVFLEKWQIIDGKEMSLESDNTLYYQSPYDIYNNKSKVSYFSSIINWKGDLNLVIESIWESLNSFIPIISILIAFILLYYLKINIKSPITINKGFFIYILSIITCLIFFNSSGTRDVFTWLYDKWIPNFEKFGFIAGYTQAGDNYPPLSFILLGFVSLFSNFTGIELLFVFKFFLLLFIVINSIIIQFITKDWMISAISNFILLINVMGLGYFDIFFAPFLILSLFCLKNKRYLSFTIFFALCCLMKYQPLIIIPFILIYIFNNDTFGEYKNKLKNLSYYVIIPALVIIVVIYLIFGNHLIISFNKALQHSFLSLNALNFNWIIRGLIEYLVPNAYENLNDGLFHFIIDTGLLSFLIKCIFYFFYFCTLILFLLKKQKDFEHFLYYSLIGYLSYVMFNIGVHENHWFLINILLIYLYIINKKYLKDLIVWAIISNVNLIMFYGMDGKGFNFSRIVFGIDITLIISLINTIIFVFYFLNIFTENMTSKLAINKTDKL